MTLYCLPKNALSNLYCIHRISSRFNEAKRRASYRAISDERKRLESLGYDPERIRLVCRYLSNMRNKSALKRLEAYCTQLDSSEENITTASTIAT